MPNKVAMIVIVMGVTGCGKSTIGRRLARRLACAFYDGDDFHSAENVEKMRQGVPLTDEDRWPWLDRLRELGEEMLTRGRSAVIACSALRASYRERLLPRETALAAKVVFVYLRISPELARERLAVRRNHYMPPSLVESQFAALEEPVEGRGVIVLDGSEPLKGLLHKAMIQLRSLAR